MLVTRRLLQPTFKGLHSLLTQIFPPILKPRVQPPPLLMLMVVVKFGGALTLLAPIMVLTIGTVAIGTILLLKHLLLVAPLLQHLSRVFYGTITQT